MTKQVIVLWQHHDQTKSTSNEQVMLKKGKGKPSKNLIALIKEATALSLLDISWAVNKQTFWRALIHR